MKTTNTNQTTNSISKKYFWKKFFSYYKPYKRLFFSDMLFACIGAGVTLILPLIIRYITSDVIYRAADEALQLILKLSLLMLATALLLNFTAIISLLIMVTSWAPKWNMTCEN